MVIKKVPMIVISCEIFVHQVHLPFPLNVNNYKIDFKLIIKDFNITNSCRVTYEYVHIHNQTEGVVYKSLRYLSELRWRDNNHE